jgi:hypothetical protein
MRRWIKRVSIGAVIFIIVLIFLIARQFRDRHPGYHVSLDLRPSTNAPLPTLFRAGFGRERINPDLSDERTPVWLAGFHTGRKALGHHDDLWAIAAVLDDGQRRVAMVALDAIGFMHDDIIDVRNQLPPDWRIDYCLITSTHNHSVPDLMGLWGPAFYRSGVDSGYLKRVKASSVSAIGEAVANLQSAQLSLHEIALSPEGLVHDSRQPEVYDPNLRLMVFTTNNSLAGTLITWANHPETAWSGNQEITADFPGFLRNALENGVDYNGKPCLPKHGGIHLYINGAVGGLMTPSPRLTVHDPFRNVDITKPGHDKSRALGHQLALRIHTALKESTGLKQDQPSLSIVAHTIELPLSNPAFYVAGMIGVIQRGHVRAGTMRSEVALLMVGDASILTVPGEIYPELVNGGIVAPDGRDFPISPAELPPLRDMMPGQVKFIFGLANDEIGYIIPKSEWDQKPPYLFGSSKPVYGESVSLGPETAPLLHAAYQKLCAKMRTNTNPAPEESATETTTNGDR